MRNPLLHLLFLAVPLLVSELGVERPARAAKLSPLTVPAPTGRALAQAKPATGAETGCAISPPPSAPRATRQPLPAHLFM